jgi:hypothetical protein
MAIVDSAYASLLQGVSQQEDSARREGQLREQINMWSDPTYGLRRRGGVATKAVIDTPCANNKLLVTEFENKVGTFYIVWNLLNSTAYVFDKNWVLKDTRVVSYLSTALSVSDVSFTSVGNTGFILNRKQTQTTTTDTTKRNPVYDAFVLVRTGAFSKSYVINVSCNGIGSFDFSYTTDNTAANSTAENVATQFKTQMDANATFTANFDVYRSGAMLFITRKIKSPANTNATVATTNSGVTYILASGSMNIPTSTDLPANMPSQADNTVVSVGTGLLSRSYYYWNATTGGWIETSSYGSYTSITGMPLPYTVDVNGLLSLESNSYPLRLSGDDNNNPYHNFVSNGITGIASYQGRLIILSGGYVSASSSLDFRKFLRTTTTSIVNTDGFEVSSSKAAGASFLYAIQFNKDLVVLGDKHQGVVPSGNTAITPVSAMLVPTGNSNLKLSCAPVATPRTIIVPNTSNDYLRIGEVVPSTLVDSQYTYQEVTDHIPSYIKGAAVTIAESSTNSHVVVLGNTETSTLLSHEYYWDGDARKQMAFSKWEFAVPIAGIHYSRDELVVVASTGNKTVIGVIKGKAPFSDGGNYMLDFYKDVSITNNVVTIPAELVAEKTKLVLASSVTSIKGEPVGIDYVDTTIHTVRSFKTGTAVVGFPYQSLMSPTSPILKDSKDVPLTDSKMILKRYLVAVRKSGEFDIKVQSDLSSYDYDGEPVLWRSSELGFDTPLVVKTGDVSIPIGIPVAQARVDISTSGTRELNIKDIQYTLKVEVRKDRRRL